VDGESDESTKGDDVIGVLSCSLSEILKANSITLAGSKLGRSWFKPDSVMEFGFEPASNQLRTSLRNGIWLLPCTFAAYRLEIISVDIAFNIIASWSFRFLREYI